MGSEYFVYIINEVHTFSKSYGIRKITQVICKSTNSYFSDVRYSSHVQYLMTATFKKWIIFMHIVCYFYDKC